MNKVTCDMCSKKFAISLKTERGPDKSEVQFFTCPHCNHRYDVARISKTGIEIRNKLRSFESQLRLSPSNDDLRERVQELQAELKAHVLDMSTRPPTQELSSS